MKVWCQNVLSGQLDVGSIWCNVNSIYVQINVYMHQKQAQLSNQQQELNKSRFHNSQKHMF